MPHHFDKPYLPSGLPVAARTIELPAAPRTSSPVPELTSIHATRRRGRWGEAGYRGNCDGYLIRNLLRYFDPRRVLDPMTGSGTCRDVCWELGIPCASFDLKSGFDASDPASYAALGRPYDFIWLHPPYWRMIRYGEDPRCLSNAATLEEFLERMEQLIGNCREVLAAGGKLAILMGSYSDRGRYLPLSSLTLERAMKAGMWPACTEIIRLQHGNTSSRKRYASRFIPGLHDVCLVLGRGEGPTGEDAP